jgi:hypothetical protein
MGPPAGDVKGCRRCGGMAGRRRYVCSHRLRGRNGQDRPEGVSEPGDGPRRSRTVVAWWSVRGESGSIGRCRSTTAATAEADQRKTEGERAELDGEVPSRGRPGH